MEEERQKMPDEVKENNPEHKIKYCDCNRANACGFEPGPCGGLICSACGSYVT